MARTSTESGIGALCNAYDVVSALSDAEAGSVSELADRLDMPKSTTHVYLQTLHDLGLVIKEEGQYRLGLQFLELGGLIRNQSEVFQAARQEIDELSWRTEEVVNLGVEERGWRILLYSSEPRRGVFDNSPVGQPTNMHWTALGKSMLAFQPAERIDEIIESHGLPRGTEDTITDPEALTDELATIREQGFAIEDQERRERIRAVGVPVLNEADDRAIAAVSVSGPKNRITEERIADTLLEEVRSTANVIALRHDYY